MTVMEMTDSDSNMTVIVRVMMLPSAHDSDGGGDDRDRQIVT